MGGKNSGRPKATVASKHKYTLTYEHPSGIEEYIGDFPSFISVADKLGVCQHPILKLYSGFTKIGTKVARYRVRLYVEQSPVAENVEPETTEIAE